MKTAGRPSSVLITVTHVPSLATFSQQEGASPELLWVRLQQVIVIVITDGSWEASRNNPGPRSALAGAMTLLRKYLCGSAPRRCVPLILSRLNFTVFFSLISSSNQSRYPSGHNYAPLSFPAQNQGFFYPSANCHDRHPFSDMIFSIKLLFGL